MLIVPQLSTESCRVVCISKCYQLVNNRHSEEHRQTRVTRGNIRRQQQHLLLLLQGIAIARSSLNSAPNYQNTAITTAAAKITPNTSTATTTTTTTTAAACSSTTLNITAKAAAAAVDSIGAIDRSNPSSKCTASVQFSASGCH